MKDKDTNQEFHFFIKRWLGHVDDTLAATSNVSPAEPNPEDKQGKKDEKASHKKSEDEKRPSKERKTKDKKAKAKAETDEADESNKEERAQVQLDKEIDPTSPADQNQNPNSYLESPAIRPDVPPLPGTVIC